MKLRSRSDKFSIEYHVSDPRSSWSFRYPTSTIAEFI